MKKVYTIGRDESCDIIINDNTDVVSRVHATLKSKGKGKYILVDQSRNGTYVNGIRMATNEEIPVTRKDIISFAHVQDLDWHQIPKSKLAARGKVIFCFLCFIVVAALAYKVVRHFNLIKKAKVTPTEVLETQPSEKVKIDTVQVRDTIYFKPKPVQKEKSDNKKTKEDEQPQKEEEVVNPIY